MAVYDLSYFLCTFSVKGEEDKTVTAGSVVTVTVRLERHNMAANISPATAGPEDFDDEMEEEKEEDGGGEEEEEESQVSLVHSLKY